MGKAVVVITGAWVMAEVAVGGCRGAMVVDRGALVGDTGAVVVATGATVGARVGDCLAGAAAGALVDRDRFRKEPKNRPNGFQMVFHTLRVEDFVVGVVVAAEVVDESPRTELSVFAS
jgi:mannitol-specific phosphotransferase system IIBC component